MLEHSIYVLKKIELFGFFKKIWATKVLEFYFFFFSRKKAGFPPPFPPYPQRNRGQYGVSWPSPAITESWIRFLFPESSQLCLHHRQYFWKTRVNMFIVRVQNTWKKTTQIEILICFPPCAPSITMCQRWCCWSSSPLPSHWEGMLNLTVALITENVLVSFIWIFKGWNYYYSKISYPMKYCNWVCKAMDQEDCLN